MVETWDAFEGIRDPKALDEKQLKGPAIGPIYVNGAEPGATLCGWTSSALRLGPARARPIWSRRDAGFWSRSSTALILR